MKRGTWTASFFVAGLFFALASGCSNKAKAADEGDPEDGGAVPVTDLGNNNNGGLSAGSTARVTASWLNLRQAAGTEAAVVVAMACGSTVTVLAGPSTTPTGWWNVSFEQNSGWASGKYLVAENDFDPSLCPTDPAPAADGGTPTIPTGDELTDIFDRAKLAVGYSYYWGHGSWRADGATRGSCNGYCPDCDHTGVYGADCSGFVAKVWQVPSPSPIDKDTHPYSTANFYNDTNREWKQIPRSELKPGDALVRRKDGAGHIVLVEDASDPFGDLMLYEARACMIGIVHNLRAVDSSFIAIRRNDL